MAERARKRATKRQPDRSKGRPETEADNLLRDFSNARDRLFQEMPRAGSYRVDLAADATYNILLPALNWSGRQLATQSGIANSQIAEWLRGKSRLGADEICRVAWAIAGGLDGAVGADATSESNGSIVYRSRLDFLVNSLLGLAGYRSGHEIVDVVWRQHFDVPSTGIAEIAGAAGDSTLKVGWYPWGTLMFVSDEEGDAGSPAGLGAELTKLVCGLLGKGTAPAGVPTSGSTGFDRWTPEQVHFQDAEGAVRSRSVHLFCPVMVASPGRYASCRFSTPIPRVRVRLAAVVSTRGFKEVGTLIRSSTNRAELPTASFPPTAIEILLPPGEVSTSLHSLIFRNSQVAPAKVTDGLEKVVRRRQLIKTLLSESPAELTRVLLTNKPLATWARDKFPDEVVCVTTEEMSKFSFELAFAVHADEPRLLDAINAAMDMLTRTGELDALIDKYAADLQASGFEIEVE